MPHYFILDAPAASPAKCGLCGFAGDGRKYLDPRLDFEFYGSLIFCESCIGTMANDFKYLSPAQAQVLESRVEEAERDNVTLRAGVLHLEAALDALNNVRSLFDDDVPAGLPVNSEPVPQHLPTLTVGAESISAADERLRDSEINESAGKQGPTGVSDAKRELDDLLADL